MRTSSLLALVVSLAPLSASAQSATQVIATVTITAGVPTPQPAEPAIATTAPATAPAIAQQPASDAPAIVQQPGPIASARANAQPYLGEPVGYILPVQELSATAPGANGPAYDPGAWGGPGSYSPYAYGQSSTALLPPARRHATWYRGGPIPAGAMLEPRRRYGVISLGAMAFAASYGATAMVGVACSYSCPGAGATLYVPVVGPLLYAMSLPYADGATVMMLAADSVIQAAGLFAVIAGIARPKHVVVTSDMARNELSRRPTRQWRFAPGAPGASAGLSIAGTF